jgi:hypothetical protein
MTKQTLLGKKHNALLVAILAGLPAAVALGWSSTARAQFRLGNDGHLNDANNQVGSNGYNGGNSNRMNNGQLNTNIITGQVGGLDYFHGKTNREINANVIDVNTGTNATDRLNAIAGGTTGGGGTRTEAPLGTTPGVSTFYSTANFVGTPPPGLALSTTANNTGLIPAPVINPLTPNDDARDPLMNDLPTNPSAGNLQTPGGIDVVGGPVDPSGSASILSMSPLYGIRGMQSGNPEDSFYQARYGETTGNTAAPGAATPGMAPGGAGSSPGTTPSIQKMRDEMNNSVPQDQPPGQPNDGTKTVPGAVSVGGTSLNANVGSSMAMPTGSVSGNLSQQSLSGDVNTGNGIQENLLIPASKQTPQLRALDQRYAQNKKLNDVQAAELFNQKKRILDAENSAAAGKTAATAQPAAPGDTLSNGTGNPTPGVTPPGVTPPGAMLPGAILPGVKPDDNMPKPAPGTVLDNTTSLAKPIVITSLATGVPSKTLADLMKTAEDRMREGKFTEAVDAYESAQKAFPNNPFIYLGRSFAELGSSYYGKADLDLRRAVLLDPAVLAGRYDLNGFLGQDRVSFIQKELTDIETRETKSGRAPTLLAFVAHNVGDDTAAVTELNAAATKGGPYPAMVEEMRTAWGIQAPAPVAAPK